MPELTTGLQSIPTSSGDFHPPQIPPAIPIKNVCNVSWSTLPRHPGPRGRVSPHVATFQWWVKQTLRAADKVPGNSLRQKHMYKVRITPHDHTTLRHNEKQRCTVLRLLMQGLSQLLRQYDWLNLWYFILTLSLFIHQAPQYFLLCSGLFCAVFKAATPAL